MPKRFAFAASFCFQRLPAIQLCIKYFIAIALVLSLPGSLIAQPISEQEKLELEQPREVMEQEVTPVKVTNVITATTTGFNSFEWQTDSTPCIAAGGYICGRVDVVACPRHIPLGTWVQIDGKNYECLDRLHPRYDARFDIFFDKDYQAALNWGRQTKQVTILG